MIRYTFGAPSPRSREVARLVRVAKAALRTLGVRIPKMQVKMVESIWASDGCAREGVTWTDKDGIVQIVFGPCDNLEETVAHEMAHAVLEPILTNRAIHHSTLWGAIYSNLYRALVEAT